MVSYDLILTVALDSTAPDFPSRIGTLGSIRATTKGSNNAGYVTPPSMEEHGGARRATADAIAGFPKPERYRPKLKSSGRYAIPGHERIWRRVYSPEMDNERGRAGARRKCGNGKELRPRGRPSSMPPQTTRFRSHGETPRPRNCPQASCSGEFPPL
jgi:hypothetical protein